MYSFLVKLNEDENEDDPAISERQQQENTVITLERILDTH